MRASEPSCREPPFAPRGGAASLRSDACREAQSGPPDGDRRPPVRKRDGGRILAVHEDSLPDLEIDEKPEPVAVIGRAGVMLRDEPLHEGRIEEAAPEGPRPQQILPGHRLERPPPPTAHRHGESQLAPR